MDRNSSSLSFHVHGWTINIRSSDVCPKEWTSSRRSVKRKQIDSTNLWMKSRSFLFQSNKSSWLCLDWNERHHFSIQLVLTIRDGTIDYVARSHSFINIDVIKDTIVRRIERPSATPVDWGKDWNETWHKGLRWTYLQVTCSSCTSHPHSHFRSTDLIVMRSNQVRWGLSTVLKRRDRRSIDSLEQALQLFSHSEKKSMSYRWFPCISSKRSLQLLFACGGREKQLTVSIERCCWQLFFDGIAQ